MLANYKTINMLARAVNENRKALNAIDDGSIKREANWTGDDVCYVCMVCFNGNINNMAAAYKQFLFAEGV